MDKTHLTGIFDSAGDKNIYIIGDVMLDRYLLGEVNRISPEAPVQVFDIKKGEFRLGGAANVSFNIKKLGANPVLIGVIGSDNEAEILKQCMRDEHQDINGLISEKNRSTTTKTRVIADAHHLLRIDSESKYDITEDTFDSIIQFLNDNVSDIDIIILQDYNKGVLTKSLITGVIEFANKNNIKVLVDPKFKNFFEYKNVYLFKPNRKELEDALGKKAESPDMIKDLAEELADKINCKYLVLTLGEHGMMLFEKNNGDVNIDIIPTHARKVADVSGAGDTVISTLAVCLAGGASIKDAVTISNFAAGLVVEEVGIVPIEKNSLIEHITNISE